MSHCEVMAIRAGRDPTVIPRVAALVAVDNRVPETLLAVCRPDGEMHITVVLRGVSSERVDYLATKIESTMASVIEVKRDQWGAETRT